MPHYSHSMHAATDTYVELRTYCMHARFATDTYVKLRTYCTHARFATDTYLPMMNYGRISITDQLSIRSERQLYRLMNEESNYKTRAIIKVQVGKYRYIFQ